MRLFVLGFALSACFAKGASGSYDSSVGVDASDRGDAGRGPARDGRVDLGDAVTEAPDARSVSMHDGSPPHDAASAPDGSVDATALDLDAGHDAATDAFVAVDAGLDAGTDAHDAALPCGGLASGAILQSGQSVLSCDGRFDLEMQPSDGNLVLYFAGAALWDAETAGNPGAYAAMQADGNFVVYSASAVALWNAGTAGNSGADLAVQSDGNLVVYSTTSVALWSSGTGGY